jgi:hypothetical protein
MGMFDVIFDRFLPEIADGFRVQKGPGFSKRYKRRKGREPTEIVLHESVTSSWKSAHSVLKRRKLSVHYTIERDGVVRQHVDPFKYYCVHAGGKHNRPSIAIEVINSYYGSRAKQGQEVIDASWAHKKRYILPTREQVESVWRLICWLDVQFDTDLRKFPAVVDDSFRWGRKKDIEREPGIKAHHRWHHADGLFIEHYCVVRSRGYSATGAYDITLGAASAKKRTTTLPEAKEL